MSQKTYKVQARSLNAAMNEVRERFGPDALVLETREMRRKEKDGLGVGTVFELTVASGNEGDEEVRVKSLGSFTHTNESLEKLQEEIARLERMASSVNDLGRRLAGIAQPDSTYPLFNLLRQEGAAAKTVKILASSFEDQVTARQGRSFRAAAVHLERYLRTVGAATWSDVSGMHFFFGAGGCGKTSLIIKLAGRIADLGGDVAIITLFPRHSGEIKRLEVVGDALGVEAAVAFSLGEFKHSMEYFGRKKAVLIDTPCILTVKELITAEFRDFICDLDIAHLHYVFDLNSSDVQLEGEIELFGQLSCNYAAITKLDITPGKARLLDLVVARPLVLSFVNDSADFDRGLEVASVRKLMSIIDPSLLSENVENGGISLNFEVDPSDEGSRRGVITASEVYSGSYVKKEGVV